MLSEVFVGLVVEALDGSFFEGPAHAFDLAVGPGVLGLGESVIDLGLGAGELEGMGAEEFSALESEPDLCGSRTAIARRGEVDSVVGEHGMDFVGTAWSSALRKSAATRRVAFSCTWTKANLEVRSIAARG